MKNITWDMGIIGAVIILLAYCFLLKRHKSLSALVSVYVAYVVTVSWGNVVVGLFTGERTLFNQMWIKANATPYLIQSVTFLVIALLLIIFVKFAGKRSHYHFWEVLSYVIFTVALSTIFILSFLPIDMKDKILAGSKIAPIIYNWREWIVLAPVILMIFFGLYCNDE